MPQEIIPWGTKLMNRKIVMVGSGGHATVLASIMRCQQQDIYAIVSNDTSVHDSVFRDLKVYPSDHEFLREHLPQNVILVHGIGITPSNCFSIQIYEKFRKNGFEYMQVIAKNSLIDVGASLGQGAQILSGSIIQFGASIGNGSVINTATSIDHHSKIGSLCHLAPGVTVCGNVTISDRCFIGAGAIILPGVNIGSDTVVSAGEVVKYDVPKNSFFVKGEIKENLKNPRDLID